MDTMSKETHYQHGMELFAEDRLDQAIEELSKALEYDSDYGDALHALAMSYYHIGDLDKAVEFGERMRAVEPRNVHAYTSLSMFYNAKGLIAKAEEMGEQAAKLAEEADLIEDQRSKVEDL
jgi:tetratricopeptide (TPR) repeat protein